ncbi:MAG: hypothetical protein HZA13_09650, partial [Nitrospirae bacterium]|nr:hypothetical protein [Nitrospirota bacterium]
RAKRALRGRRRSSVGARAVQLLLRCPHTPRLHRPSRMLASALPVEGDGRSPEFITASGVERREGEAPSGFAGGGGWSLP